MTKHEFEVMKGLRDSFEQRQMKADNPVFWFGPENPGPHILEPYHEKGTGDRIDEFNTSHTGKKADGLVYL